MKFIHLSDLHLGKRVNEFSMTEDQEYILEEILRIIRQEQPDGVLLAGDIYDKAVPSAEAVRLFDWFLTSLSETGTETFLISGNHDSPERLSFGSRLMERSGIHISRVYDGRTASVRLEDRWGAVQVYLLPFIKPSAVRGFFPEREILSYTDAVRTAVEEMAPDRTMRNILVAHQFVTGAARSESEEISVGGMDNVDASVFEPFDYVALGHIHGPQNIGSERVRYCGTPLKYSFSEAGQEKSVTVAELGKKGDLTVRTIPLIPRRDMKEIRGSYMELTARSFYEDRNREDYVHITLTDEEDIRDAAGKLRVIYPNLMRLDYDNLRTRSSGLVQAAEQVEQKTPLELFRELYRAQNNQDMTDEQEQLVKRLLEEIREEEA